MLASRAGAKAEADFLRDVADGVYELVPVTSSEVSRAADLVEQYASLSLGTADAFVVIDFVAVFKEMLPRGPVTQPSWPIEILRDYWRDARER